MFSKRFLFLIIFILMATIIGIAGYLFFARQQPVFAIGNIINAASCEQADVWAAINSAIDGDTVMVPAGTCIWSATLSIIKGITLQGSGMDSTIIISSSGSTIVSYAPINPSLNEKFRLTGFTFDGAGRSVKGVLVSNASTISILNNIRIDHNKIMGCDARSIEFNGMIYGLIDNNIIIGTGSNNNRMIAIYGKDAYSWLDPLQIGTSNYAYIESNTISNGEALVASYGVRWVFRYNDVYANSCQPSLDAHGNLACSSPLCQWDCVRGQVAAEVYENTWHGLSGGCKIIDHRAGTGMIFNNKAESTMGPGNTSIRLREEESSTLIGACYPLKLDKPGYDPIINTYVFGNTVSISGAQPIHISMYWNEYNEMDLITEKIDYWTDTVIGGNTDTGYVERGLGNARSLVCSNDDIYWETDTKKLYRCNGVNNWVFIYTPYTYPHLLTIEIDTTPSSAPTGLVIQ